jgi:hypothetical protein
MALNDDWLADVRRWYFDERDERDERAPAAGSAAQLSSDLSDGAEAVGYEAALPALQFAQGEMDGSPAVDRPRQPFAHLR